MDAPAICSIAVSYPTWLILHALILHRLISSGGEINLSSISIEIGNLPLKKQEWFTHESRTIHRDSNSSRSTRRMHVYCTLEDTELAINLANSLSKPTHYKPPKSPVPITARNEHVRGAAAAAARKLASSLEFPRRKLDNRKAKGKEERHPRWRSPRLSPARSEGSDPANNESQSRPPPLPTPLLTPYLSEMPRVRVISHRIPAISLACLGHNGPPLRVPSRPPPANAPFLVSS